MKGLGRLGRAVGATVVASAVIAGSLAVGGIVFASGKGGSNQPTTAGASQSGATARLRPLAGALHADMTWTLRDGSSRQSSADFGQIAAVGNGSITVKRADGKSVTATVGTATCIRNDGQPATLGDLKVGERAAVVQGGGSTLAIRARDREPKTGTGREGCHLLQGVVHGEITVTYKDGSARHWTYDRGQITSIISSQISFKRADGQSVTLGYDSSTIVREKGQRVPISDLKVGERAMFFSQGGHAVLIRCVTKATATTG